MQTGKRYIHDFTIKTVRVLEEGNESKKRGPSHLTSGKAGGL